MVNSSKNVHQVALDYEENCIRKSRKQGSVHARNDLLIQQRRLFKPPDLQLKGSFIFQAQTSTLRLIPFVRFADLTNGPARKRQAVCHDPFFNFSFT